MDSSVCQNPLTFFICILPITEAQEEQIPLGISSKISSLKLKEAAITKATDGTLYGEIFCINLL